MSMPIKKQKTSQTGTAPKLQTLKQDFDSEFAAVEKQYQAAHDELEQIMKEPRKERAAKNTSS